MIREVMSVEKFIHQVFQNPSVSEIYNQWSVDPIVLEETIAKTFKEIGVYTIAPNLHQFFGKVVVDRLKSAPEIHRLVETARANSSKIFENTRHAE